MASAGQVTPKGPPPYYVLIERALRDEGTSHHYLPPSRYVAANPELLTLARTALSHADHRVYGGATWTTDAPFRETAEVVYARRNERILAVEMEAAALYAFGQACGRPVLCLAHVSNQLGQIEGDFEKGQGNGAETSLRLLTAVAAGWVAQHTLCEVTK
jgi:nucleoside phosphorylase